MTYLDNAATTLYKPKSVQKAVCAALKESGGAGRGGHAAALRAAEIIYGARETAAELFRMRDPERVIFTSNGTHSLNIAIKSLAARGGRVVVSGFEHNAVIRPLYRLSQEIGVKVDVIPTPLFEPEMAVSLFEMALDGDVCLAVCTHVSNVFGYVLPIERIWALCKHRGVPLIVDAAQSAGVLPIAGDSGPYFCMPGHKGLYGPQGTGLLLCPPDGLILKNLIEGGTGSASSDSAMPNFYPDRLEAGTPNAPSIAGLNAGMRYIINSGIPHTATEFDLSDPPHRKMLYRLHCSLAAIWGVKSYYTDGLYCQSGVISFNIEGQEPESVAARLAAKGIAVRAGLHCAPTAHKTAGTFPGGTVRASIGAFNTTADIRRLAAAVRGIVKG
ncbi:MAG: aminotransferase class V-fold PLP-dependent enzyme [Oscillospiraceae bacterium]|jgi:selenocysteine lyase/cysteine desulfurase|nr:aminotransferase class V-fold PLP-dependent enzyme [Oscillospiraceae bacterium]